MSRMAEQYARPQLPLSPPLLEACQRHNWPGNLRELNNFLKRYLILGDENLAAAELQPRHDGNGGGAHGDSASRGSESSGGLKSLAALPRTKPKAKPSGKRSNRPTGTANRQPACYRSATKPCSTRFGNIALPKPRAITSSPPELSSTTVKASE